MSQVPDLLLAWASEVGSGSWSQFRAAHEWAIAADDAEGWVPTPGFTLRMLATLGHVDIDWAANRWSASPPVVTLLPSAGAHALVTGGRTRALITELHAKADAVGEVFVLEPIPQPHAPSAVLMACDSETGAAALAQSIGALYEYSVSDRLSRLLPELDSCLKLRPATPPARGYGVDRFDVEALRWLSVTSDREPGLYRYDLYGRPEYRLVEGATEIFAVDQAVGVWAALSRWGENQLRYRAEEVNGTLVVRLTTPLPTLQARTAALCSGLAPRKQGSTLWYRNVPRVIAERIARSLDQTLMEQT